MAKERTWQYRNTGTEANPIWEKYYPKTIADAIMMSDADTETVNVKTYIDSGLGNKVDKISGKGLSAEDYTAAEKSKLSTISTSANKVEASANNGKIKIDGAEASVYTHPTGTNPHGTTKADVGLGNVNNTADLAKPISTAAQTALADKVDKISGQGLSSN
ncbi:MAG: hypothetical protein RSC43_08615, partial [Clostridia bacterium]